MKRPQNRHTEPIKRFLLTPKEHDSQLTCYHCTSQKTWLKYLLAHFSTKLREKEFRYKKTISNASYRLTGLEMKVGLLLADDEAKYIDGKTVSDDIRPSLVIDSVLSTFSVLEGLTFLSYIANLQTDQRKSELVRAKRGDKISKGLKSSIGYSRSKEVKCLRGLRDRCIHQDRADLKDNLDYDLLFHTDELRPHIELLCEYLSSLATSKSSLPNTNLIEFWTLDIQR